MSRQRHVQQRKRIFLAVEGNSERSFAAWLGRLCEKNGCNVHLDVKVAGGGDTLSIAEYAVKQYNLRSRRFGKYYSGFVMLDHDRYLQDKHNNRDVNTAGTSLSLNILWQRPNMEGVLLRMHEGYEQRFIDNQNTLRLLRNLWPEYSKKADADDLSRRFNLLDICRMAAHDNGFNHLLKTIGLI